MKYRLEVTIESEKSMSNTTLQFNADDFLVLLVQLSEANFEISENVNKALADLLIVHTERTAEIMNQNVSELYSKLKDKYGRRQ